MVFLKTRQNAISRYGAKPIKGYVFMEWYEITSDWAMYSKKVQSNWNKLPIEQITSLNGNHAGLSSLIKKYYQCSEEEAEAQIQLWLSNLLGHSKSITDNLDEKLKDNQDSAETIVERDEIVGSPYHKGY
jgi:hypothetical protein